jgi:hypothetical protein
MKGLQKTRNSVLRFYFNRNKDLRKAKRRKRKLTIFNSFQLYTKKGLSPQLISLFFVHCFGQVQLTAKHFPCTLIGLSKHNYHDYQ